MDVDNSPCHAQLCLDSIYYTDLVQNITFDPKCIEKMYFFTLLSTYEASRGWLTVTLRCPRDTLKSIEMAGTYPRTMTSLVSSWDTQGLQSQSIRNLAQSLWRKRRVAPIRSRSFILLGPYWTAEDSSLVKKSRWNTGGASSKYRAANLVERRMRIGRSGCSLQKS